MALPARPVSGANSSGNHVVVKDGKFFCIVSETRDGNFVIIKPEDPVYLSLDDAISAALYTPQEETNWNA